MPRDKDEDYGGGLVARANLTLPDDLHAEVIRLAALAGVSPNSYMRTAVAWRVGRAGALDEIAELRAELADCRAEVGQLRRELHGEA